MTQRSEQDEIRNFRASIDEEIDALEVNLVQDGDESQDGEEARDLEDGSGLIGDDVARERIEALTEVGEDAGDRGVISVAPGRDDTSAVLRRHNPNNSVAEIEEGLEASLDEPRGEAFSDREEDR